MPLTDELNLIMTLEILSICYFDQLAEEIKPTWFDITEKEREIYRGKAWEFALKRNKEHV